MNRNRAIQVATYLIFRSGSAVNQAVQRVDLFLREGSFLLAFRFLSVSVKSGGSRWLRGWR